MNPIRDRRALRLTAVLTSLLALVSTHAAALASPPAGPYGPIHHHYDVPADAAHVIYVAPNGDASAAGDAADRPTTLGMAIERATTGDAIIMRGGVYRTGSFEFNQGFTVQPYEDEIPILDGTRIATDWQPVRGGLWRTKWDTLFPAPPADWWQRDREVARTPLHRFNNDMVFVDGKMLQSAGWAGEVTRDTYWIDYDDGYVYVAVNPEYHLIEITAHDVALLRTFRPIRGAQSDGRGITVRGLTIQKYAFRGIEIEGRDPNGPADEADYGHDAVGTTFEDCTLRHFSRVAGYFRGNNLVIRRCLVSDTSTEGIFVLASNDALLEQNIITRNNTEGITGYYTTAVKIFNQCNRAVVRENLITDHPQPSSGVWYDVGNTDGVFVNNRVERTDNGFFFEISKGAICAGNVFVDCETGVKVLNSRDVRIVANTFVNSRIHISRDGRSAEGDHFGWHPQTGPDVDERTGHVIASNLMVADEIYREPLVRFGQSPLVRDRAGGPQVAEMNHNAYIRRTARDERPLVVWAPADDASGDHAYNTLGAFRDERGYETDGQAWFSYYGPLFRNRHASQYEPLAVAPAASLDAPIPSDIAQLIGRSATGTAPGAYPANAHQ